MASRGPHAEQAVKGRYLREGKIIHSTIAMNSVCMIYTIKIRRSCNKVKIFRTNKGR